VLPAIARTITLDCIVREHQDSCWLECAVIMPDHVHVILMPYLHTTLDRIMKTIRRISAHQINKAAHRHGSAWQREPFDHILRIGERARQKAEYVCMNPVRAGLAQTPDQYPWLWRSWIEGER